MTSTQAPQQAPTGVRGLPSIVVAMLFRSAGVVALLAIPVVSGLGSVDAGAPGSSVDGTERHQGTAWKAAYSVRYPGCVPSVLWPADENPVAVVTKSPDGSVAKVTLEGGRLPMAAVPAGARTIGACR